MPRSETLQSQWALYDNKEYDQAVKETEAVVDGLQGAELREAQRLLGLACLRQQEYHQALEWFQKACQGSENADDWLNLAISAALEGQHELGAESFEQVRLIQQAARHRQGPGLYQQLFGYATAVCDHGDYERLPPLLDELAQAYRRVQSSETAHLYVVGLPFLSSFLVLAIRHFHGAKEHAQGVAWLQSLGEALDEEGQQQVAQAVRDLKKLGERGE
jgi:tetratricopeptide (TPR) repeat protein